MITIYLLGNCKLVAKGQFDSEIHFEKTPRLTERDFKNIMNYYLTSAEKKKIERLKINTQKQKDMIWARFSLKKNLARQYLIENLSSIEIISLDTYPFQGKPLFISTDRNLEDLHVSLTYDNGVIGTGFSKDRIGIDIEHIFSKVVTSFINYSFNDAEVNYVRQIHGYRFNEILTLIWCIKECFVKAIGSGFIYGPKSISVFLNKDLTKCWIFPNDEAADLIADPYSQSVYIQFGFSEVYCFCSLHIRQQITEECF